MVPFATDHRTPSVGWSLVEDERPGRFHREKAEALGVPQGPLFGDLQHGRAVTLPDGRTVRPEEVVEAPPRGRKLALSGDTPESLRACGATAAFADLSVGGALETLLP